MAVSILPLFIFVLLIALFPLGVFLIFRGLRGVPTLSEPHCAKCGYDLRGLSADVRTRCSECGADLTSAHAVRWGDYRRRPRLAWIGGVFLLLPILAIISLLFVRSTINGSPFSPNRSTAVVLTSLSTNANAPWDWQLLDQRLASGALSASEVTQAIDNRIASLKKSPSDQPLSWSQSFVEHVDKKSLIGDEQYLRLARAFYPPEQVALPLHARQGSHPTFRIQGGGHWDLPGVHLVKALRRVTLADGREIHPIGQDPNVAESLSATSPWDIDGAIPIDLAPGTYNLTFVIDVASLDPNAVPHLFNGKPGPAVNWPKGRAKWVEQVTVPLIVIATDAPMPVVTDPALDPVKNGWLHVNFIKISRGSGTIRHAAVEIVADGKTVPMSFDVCLDISGKEYPLGSIVANGGLRSGLGCQFPSLSPDVLLADVVLRPAPAKAEILPGYDRIWGGEIKLTNIQMQRFDMEAADQDTTKPSQ